MLFCYRSYHAMCMVILHTLLIIILCNCVTFGIIVQNPQKSIPFSTGTVHFTDTNSEDFTSRIENILWNGCDLAVSNVEPIDYQYLVKHVAVLIQSMVGFTLPMIGLAYSDPIVIFGRHMSASFTENNTITGGHMYTLSREYLSHNLCVHTAEYKNNRVNPSLKGGPISLGDKELMYQISMCLHPWNVFAIKNYGFHLEWQGFASVADQLYFECLSMTHNAGCYAHYSMISPPMIPSFLSQNSFAERNIQRMMRIILLLRSERSLPLPYSKYIHTNCDLTHTCAISNTYDPIHDIREFPLNPQYSGFVNVDGVYTLWSHLLGLLYPSLLYVAPEVRSGAMVVRAPEEAKANRVNIRIGVVSESGSNSSPLLCIYPILEKLGVTRYQRTGGVYHASTLDLDRDASAAFDIESESVGIEFIYFARQEDRQARFHYELQMRELAVETHFISSSDLVVARKVISGCSLDILFYLSLPTEKFSYLLAHSRLAPVQVQYGLGHPISSGISGSILDYRILSSHMLDNPHITLHNEKENLVQSDPNSQDLYMDGIGYYLHDPIDFYVHLEDDSGLEGATPDVDEVLSLQDVQLLKQYPESYVLTHMTCDKLQQLFQLWNIATNITDSQILKRCQPSPRTLDPSVMSMAAPTPRSVYYCIQNPKKMHPWMDEVFFGIIRKDATALFLLSSKALGVIDRWRWKMAAEEPHMSGAAFDALIAHHFLFIPRISHLHNLVLLSMSHVFLNPYPFGAGITSSEAIAMCVPVVTVVEPRQPRSVLHFALAQIQALGDDIKSVLSVPLGQESYPSGIEAARITTDSNREKYSSPIPQQPYIDRCIELRQNTTIKDLMRQRKVLLFDEEKVLYPQVMEYFQLFLRLSS